MIPFLFFQTLEPLCRNLLGKSLKPLLIIPAEAFQIFPDFQHGGILFFQLDFLFLSDSIRCPAPVIKIGYSFTQFPDFQIQYPRCPVGFIYLASQFFQKVLRLIGLVTKGHVLLFLKFLKMFPPITCCLLRLFRCRPGFVHIFPGHLVFRRYGRFRMMQGTAYRTGHPILQPFRQERRLSPDKAFCQGMFHLAGRDRGLFHCLLPIGPLFQCLFQIRQLTGYFLIGLTGRNKGVHIRL